MQETPRIRWQRLLVLPLVVALIVLVAAVSSWAAGSPSATGSSATPSFVPVQDSEQEEGDGRPRGHDCPERDGDGGSSGDSQSQPDASSSPAPQL